jgi:hypothetical protein
VREPARWSWRGLPSSMGHVLVDRCVRPARQGRGPRELCKRAASALWTWVARHCGCGLRVTVQLGSGRIRPIGLQFIFLFSKYIQILANLKICVGFI